MDEKLYAIASRAKTSMQYVYPSMDKIYCIESPYQTMTQNVSSILDSYFGNFYNKFTEEIMCVPCTTTCKINHDGSEL